MTTLKSVLHNFANFVHAIEVNTVSSLPNDALSLSLSLLAFCVIPVVQYTLYFCTCTHVCRCTYMQISSLVTLASFVYFEQGLLLNLEVSSAKLTHRWPPAAHLALVPFPLCITFDRCTRLSSFHVSAGNPQPGLHVVKRHFIDWAISPCQRHSLCLRWYFYTFQWKWPFPRES